MFRALAALAALAVVAAPHSARLTATPIAFTSDRAGNLDIYVTDATGERTTRLTADAGDDASPSWSPDGKQLAFASNQKGYWSIWTMNADGTSQHPITSTTAADTNPVWSPDGRSIAFTTSRDGDWEVYVMSPTGTGVRDVSNDHAADDLQPTWSPDSSTIVFERVSARGRSDLYRVSTKGSAAIHPLFAGGSLPAFDPAYSPSGGQIAFDRRAKTNYDIWVVSSNGTGARRITSSPAEDTQPTWSPDGTQLAFTSARDGDYEVYVTDLKGRLQRDVTRRPDASDFEPSWARTGAVPVTRAVAAVETGIGCTTATTGPPGAGTTAQHLFGSAVSDVLCGTPNGEWLSALGYPDTLFGNAGGDYLEGGGDNDRFYTKDGERDTLYGGTSSADAGRGDGARVDRGLDVLRGIENPNL